MAFTLPAAVTINTIYQISKSSDASLVKLRISVNILTR